MSRSKVKHGIFDLWTDLQQEVGGVVDTHHEAPDSRHVVDVRKADQANCRQVMDEHYQEVLKWQKGEREKERGKRERGIVSILVNE